ncbi:MAG TPA: MFS transporter [Anaerolineae bacterium]|nr:MFS transporter [Anaerolineae bacterium]
MSSSTPSAPAAALPRALTPNERRSFVLGVSNGAAFTFAESLIAADLVLTNFVGKLTASNFLIGLVVPLRDAGWFLPQLFVSSYLQYRERVLPIYRVMAVARTIAWLGMAAVVFAVQDPGALLLLFFLLYSVNSLASGVAGLSFMDVVAKTIPGGRRGSFFAGRLFFGSLLGLLASVIVSAALGGTLGLSYLDSIGVLFLVSWASAVLGLLAFGTIREPPGEIREEPATLGAHVRRAARLPRDNREFRLLLVGRVMLILSYVAAPFYGVYATRELGADERILGVFLAARTLSFLVANPAWARLSDRRGNRLVMLIALVFGLLMPSVALAAKPVMSLLAVPHTQWALVYVSVFLLWGLFESGIGVGAVNLLLDFAPPRDRVTYVGLTNSVLGVALLSTSLGGALVDLIGISSVFLLSLGCLAASLVAFYKMREPRDPSTALPAPFGRGLRRAGPSPVDEAHD